MNRKRQMQKLRDKRYTYREIGEIFGVSRQRVQQILYNKNKSKMKLNHENTSVDIKKEVLDKIKTIKINTNKNISQLTNMPSGTRDRNRELVRIRDNHTCQICGKKWKKGERKLDVHHIDEDNKKTRKVDDLSNEADNMITLCHKCHLNLPEHRKTMVKSQKSIVDKK